MVNDHFRNVLEERLESIEIHHYVLCISLGDKWNDLSKAQHRGDSEWQHTFANLQASNQLIN